MASEVLINIVNKVIVFTCPSCSKTGGFPLEKIKTMQGESADYPCGHCNAGITFDSAKIEGAVRLMKRDDPSLAGPYDVKFVESPDIGVEAGVPAANGSARAGAGDNGHGVIIVIDSDEMYRKDILKIFEGVARVEAYGGGSKGSVDFINQWAKEAILIIIDVYLGDGTFIDVLNGIKTNDRATKISTIVVHPVRKDRAIIEQMVLPYSQVKRIIHKDDLLKRLTEVADRFPKKNLTK
jgi:hypothetical protein